MRINNNKNHLTTTIIIGKLLLIILLGAGCSKTNNENVSQTQTETRRPERATSFRSQGDPATKEDLIIDETIIVVGNFNTDGSVSAETIWIGSMPVGNFTRSATGTTNVSEQNDQSATNNRPADINVEDLGNLSPEERRSRFQELRNSDTVSERTFAGRRGGNRAAGDTGNTVVRGKIKATDNSSIVLEVADGGGSKIIFFSDSTNIFKTPEETSEEVTDDEN